MYIFLTFAVLLASAALAAGKPTDSENPLKLDISSVMNKTVCPIKIDIDYDPNRIPRRIKVMKCDHEPNRWCSKMNVPKHECCQHQHAHVKLECVEVQDTVQVYYPKEKLTELYAVSVGCACLLERADSLPEVQPSR